MNSGDHCPSYVRNDVPVTIACVAGPILAAVAAGALGSMRFFGERSITGLGADWAAPAAAVYSILSAALSAAAFMACRRAPIPAARLASIAAPLTWTGLLAPVILFRSLLPARLVAGALFYLPVFLVSLSIARALLSAQSFWDRVAERTPAWAAVAALTVLFALTGLYWTRAAGEHSGDEGHYIIQVASLREDLDLDLRNNLEALVGRDFLATLDSEALHISPASRSGHWHSYHPPGLPLLLAFLTPGGVVSRHVLLGVIAAMAALAAWRLCRMAGATTGASNLACAGFFGSLYGVVYASRCLPEMLGACLLAWLCWCSFSQERAGWATAIAAAACCVFLPWAHLRFYPPAIVGMLLYTAEAVRLRESALRKTGRLGLFLFLCMGGLVFHRCVQADMYSGGLSHAAATILFSMPSGLWRVFADRNGLLNVFPFGLALVASAAAWPFAARRPVKIGLAAAAMFASAWLTSCAGFNYFGGATLPGRFLVVVMPLLLPGAAAMWDRTSEPARWWMALLALVSIALGALELVFLPSLQRSFAFPFQALSSAAPILTGLPLPFNGWPDALAGLVLTFIVLVAGRRLALAAVALALMLLLCRWAAGAG